MSISKPHGLKPNDETVLDALGHAQRPLSAYEILDQARSGTLKAPVQVYRSLQKLAERGLIHRIEALNAFVACSEAAHVHQAAAAHKPGFVICRDCGTAREFEDARIDGIAAEAAGAGFAIQSVSMEVFGRCGRCVAGAAGA